MKKLFLVLISFLFFSNNYLAAEIFLTKNIEKINDKEVRLEIDGLYNKPKGSGPFPAVIILQSCGGSKPHLF